MQLINAVEKTTLNKYDRLHINSVDYKHHTHSSKQTIPDELNWLLSFIYIMIFN